MTRWRQEEEQEEQHDQASWFYLAVVQEEEEEEESGSGRGVGRLTLGCCDGPEEVTSRCVPPTADEEPGSDWLKGCPLSFNNIPVVLFSEDIGILIKREETMGFKLKHDEILP